MQAVWHLHRFVYRLSGGRLGRSAGGHPNLLLRTRGRRSGQTRETLLWYVDDAPNVILVASNAGSDRHPAWFLNLVATPEVEIRIGDRWRRVRARRARGRELGAAWQRVDEVNPSYGGYRAAASREIPVMILEPLG